MTVYSLPEAMDWNEDGLTDIILCGKNKDYSSPNVLLYLNIGTKTQHRFGAPINLQSDGKDIYHVSPHTPHVIDYNRDGKKDLMIGTASGKIAYYENIGENENPVLTGPEYLFHGEDENEFFIEKTWGGTSVPEVKPHFCDWNKDGKWDIILGGGKVVYDLYISYGERSTETLSKENVLPQSNVSIVEKGQDLVITNSLSASVHVALFKANGAIVEQRSTLGAGEKRVLSNTLAQGIYFVKVWNGSYAQKIKFVKQ